ncbi:hypothetical protein [Polyangium sorediatum]|uniref:Lipoprotein n=1 Tax=Polyangium sorediatum TaxID=889274 RepID=A0ABT6P5W2_9BACT|nr:hypothetical protein [Polyangium sorediatum]MDI1435692.1 hypothetical protein [Polyangium sorediatum]
MTGLNGRVARIVRAAVRRASVIMTAAMAVIALEGCTFGDEAERAYRVDGLIDDNCVPMECLFVCCQGWAYKPEPRLRGGNLPGHVCEEVRKKHPDYSEYIYLMGQPENLCANDFKYFESGYCYDIQPPDAIKEFSPDGQPLHSGLSFSVCPPRGQEAAHPLEDLEFIYTE